MFQRAGARLASAAAAAAAGAGYARDLRAVRGGRASTHAFRRLLDAGAREGHAVAAMLEDVGAGLTARGVSEGVGWLANAYWRRRGGWDGGRCAAEAVEVIKLARRRRLAVPPEVYRTALLLTAEGRAWEPLPRLLQTAVAAGSARAVHFEIVAEFAANHGPPNTLHRTLLNMAAAGYALTPACIGSLMRESAYRGDTAATEYWWEYAVARVPGWGARSVLGNDGINYLLMAQASWEPMVAVARELIADVPAGSKARERCILTMMYHASRTSPQRTTQLLAQLEDNASRPGAAASGGDLAHCTRVTPAAQRYVLCSHAHAGDLHGLLHAFAALPAPQQAHKPTRRNYLLALGWYLLRGYEDVGAMERARRTRERGQDRQLTEDERAAWQTFQRVWASVFTDEAPLWQFTALRVVLDAALDGQYTADAHAVPYLQRARGRGDGAMNVRDVCVAVACEAAAGICGADGVARALGMTYGGYRSGERWRWGRPPVHSFAGDVLRWFGLPFHAVSEYRDAHVEDASDGGGGGSRTAESSTPTRPGRDHAANIAVACERLAARPRRQHAQQVQRQSSDLQAVADQRGRSFGVAPVGVDVAPPAVTKHDLVAVVAAGSVKVQRAGTQVGMATLVRGQGRAPSRIPDPPTTDGSAVGQQGEEAAVQRDTGVDVEVGGVPLPHAPPSAKSNDAAGPEDSLLELLAGVRHRGHRRGLAVWYTQVFSALGRRGGGGGSGARSTPALDLLPRLSDPWRTVHTLLEHLTADRDAGRVAMDSGLYTALLQTLRLHRDWEGLAVVCSKAEAAGMLDERLMSTALSGCVAAITEAGQEGDGERAARFVDVATTLWVSSRSPSPKGFRLYTRMMEVYAVGGCVDAAESLIKEAPPVRSLGNVPCPYLVEHFEAVYVTAGVPRRTAVERMRRVISQQPPAAAPEAEHSE